MPQKTVMELVLMSLATTRPWMRRGRPKVGSRNRPPDAEEVDSLGFGGDFARDATVPSMRPARTGLRREAGPSGGAGSFVIAAGVTIK